MKLPRWRRLLHLSRITVTIGFAIASAAPTASDAAEIKVLTTRAMNHVLTELGGAFQRTSEHKIALILAPPAEIRRRIVNGEIVDVAISGSGIIEDLVQQGKIARDSALTLASVGYGVAVRAGSAKPDIASVEAFKRALLAARSIVYTDPAVGGASGIHFEKVLDRLAIAKKIKAKSILNARAATTANAEIVAWRSRTRHPTDQRNRVRPRRRAARAPAGRAAGHERDCSGNCHDRKRAGRRQGVVQNS
jgi:ABC-type molybdate transport system substrate-binding protein